MRTSRPAFGIPYGCLRERLVSRVAGADRRVAILVIVGAAERRRVCCASPPARARRVAGYVDRARRPARARAGARCPFRDDLRPLTVGSASWWSSWSRPSRRPARPRHRRRRSSGSSRSTSSSCRRTARSRSNGPEYVTSLFVFLGLSILISFLFARAAERADGRRGARGRAPDACRSSAATSSCRGPGEETYRALLEHVVAAVRLRPPARSSSRMPGVGARRAGGRRRRSRDGDAQLGPGSTRGAPPSGCPSASGTGTSV